MVRTTKAEKQTVAPVAPAPVENVVVEAAAAAPKKTKKAAAKVEAAPVVAAPSPAPEPEQVATETTESTIFDKLAEYGAKLQQVSNLQSTLRSDYKTLEKSVVREIKAAQKSSSRRKKASSGNRAPSGFTKPAPISDELAVFLGKSAGIEMSRTDVSKEINAYINSLNLKDEKNGRIIHPDSKLTVLLNVKDGEQLTYFNLQKYMKHHFIKKAAVATA
jgi:chromatin remodeling complex protein RSC6